MQAIINQLKENAQLLFRKAIDADRLLDELQQQGKGKHQSVFNADAGFTTKSTRFQPYVQEVMQDIESLVQQEASELEAQLKALVKKIELLFTTLSNLSSTKD